MTPSHVLRPCSPVSDSTASESSRPHSASDSADDITPRPGPSDLTLRTADALSRAALPIESCLPSDQWDRDAEGHPRNPFTDTGRASTGAGKGRNQRRSVTFVKQERDHTHTTSSQQLRSNSSNSSNNSDTPASVMNAISRHSPSVSPRRGLQNGHRRDTDDRPGESSADEQTSIVGRNRTPGQTNYGAVTVGNDDAHQRDQVSGQQVFGERSPKLRKGGALKSSLRGSIRNGGRIQARQAETNPATEHNGHDSNGWLKGLIEKYGSVELENKGSVARDHLALERTFLAWLRTSLSFASIGIAVTQLFRLNTSIAANPDSAKHTPVAATARLRSVGKPLGATFLGISILILLLGFHRYFESQHYVIRGKFPASRGTIVIVSIVAAALIVTSLIVVVVVAPEAFEK